MKKTLIAAGLCAILLTPVAHAAKQPAMERALKNLERAEKLLKVAARNKKGHRVKALFHVKKAIKQVKQGIAAANQ